MGSGKRELWESARSHLQVAKTVDDPAKRTHHVREAAQLLEGVRADG